MVKQPAEPLRDAVASASSGNDAPRFDQAAAYELFMTPWSVEAGRIFLDWLALPNGKIWLDVGCGTGALTRLIAERCNPRAVIGADSEPAQITYARGYTGIGPEQFVLGDAHSLPFAGRSFDVVTSALTLNFVADRDKALREMLRVARRGAVIAAYVWDFTSDLSPSGPLRLAMKQMGIQLPEIPGAKYSTLHSLRSGFQRVGLTDVVTRTIDISMKFLDFRSFWHAQTSSHGATTDIIADLSTTQRTALEQAVRSTLSVKCSVDTFAYSARANAIKARIPD